MQWCLLFRVESYVCCVIYRDSVFPHCGGWAMLCYFAHLYVIECVVLCGLFMAVSCSMECVCVVHMSSVI